MHRNFVAAVRGQWESTEHRRVILTTNSLKLVKWKRATRWPHRPTIEWYESKLCIAQAAVLDHERWALSIDYMFSFFRKWHRETHHRWLAVRRCRLERLCVIFLRSNRQTGYTVQKRTTTPSLLRPPVIVGGLLITLTFTSAEGGNSIFLFNLSRWKCELLDLPAWALDLVRAGYISLKIVLASAWQRHFSGLLPRPPICLSGLCEIGITTKGTMS